MAAIVGTALLLPIGGLLGAPVAMLGAFWLTAFLAFGLIALLYPGHRRAAGRSA